jgi:membrane associated rhomboid family serine protease
MNMETLLAALAVYKLIQFFKALLPKKPMPWVTLLFSLTLGILAAAYIRADDWLLYGLAIATLSGACHAVLRVITLHGDLALKRVLTR